QPRAPQFAFRGLAELRARRALDHQAQHVLRDLPRPPRLLRQVESEVVQIVRLQPLHLPQLRRQLAVVLLCQVRELLQRRVGGAAAVRVEARGRGRGAAGRGPWPPSSGRPPPAPGGSGGPPAGSPPSSRGYDGAVAYPFFFRSPGPRRSSRSRNSATSASRSR